VTTGGTAAGGGEGSVAGAGGVAGSENSSPESAGAENGGVGNTSSAIVEGGAGGAGGDNGVAGAAGGPGNQPLTVEQFCEDRCARLKEIGNDLNVYPFECPRGDITDASCKAACVNGFNAVGGVRFECPAKGAEYLACLDSTPSSDGNAYSSCDETATATYGIVLGTDEDSFSCITIEAGIYASCES
jgi:hypothetical protein